MIKVKIDCDEYYPVYFPYKSGRWTIKLSQKTYSKWLKIMKLSDAMNSYIQKKEQFDSANCKVGTEDTDSKPPEPKKRETGWIDGVFFDFLKDSTYHLEENLPALSEVIAEACFEFVEKLLISEFVEDIEQCENLSQVLALKKKWEEKLK